MKKAILLSIVLAGTLFSVKPQSYPKPREQSDYSLTTPIIVKEVMIREKLTKAT